MSRTVTGLRLASEFIDVLDERSEEENVSRSEYMRRLMLKGLSFEEDLEVQDSWQRK
jgi:metal-responsive CopG/Arc/MetJ family transcriptional regulator